MRQKSTLAFCNKSSGGEGAEQSVAVADAFYCMPMSTNTCGQDVPASSAELRSAAYS